MKKRLKFLLGVSAFAALSVADVGCMIEESAPARGSPRVVETGCIGSGMLLGVVKDFIQRTGVEDKEATSCILNAFEAASKICEDPRGLLMRMFEICSGLELEDCRAGPYIDGMRLLQIVARNSTPDEFLAEAVMSFLQAFREFGETHEDQQIRLTQALSLVPGSVDCMFGRVADHEVCDAIMGFIANGCLPLSVAAPDPEFNPYIFGQEVLRVLARSNAPDPVGRAVRFCQHCAELCGTERRASLIEVAPFVPMAIMSATKAGADGMRLVAGLLSGEVGAVAEVARGFVGAFVEFHGFDPGSLVIKMLAMAPHHFDTILQLFDVAGTRASEVRAGAVLFHQFVESVFQELDAGLNGASDLDKDRENFVWEMLQTAEAALSDVVFPAETALVREVLESNEIYRELTDMLREFKADGRPTDAEVESLLSKAFGADRSCIPVYAYQVLGELLKGLDRSLYDSIDVLSSFYPWLEGRNSRLKQAFLRSIGFQLSWLHQVFVVEGRNGRDLLTPLVAAQLLHNGQLESVWPCLWWSIREKNELEGSMWRNE